jgi:hypothetical protein
MTTSEVDQGNNCQEEVTEMPGRFSKLRRRISMKALTLIRKASTRMTKIKSRFQKSRDVDAVNGEGELASDKAKDDIIVTKQESKTSTRSNQIVDDELSFFEVDPSNGVASIENNEVDSSNPNHCDESQQQKYEKFPGFISRMKRRISTQLARFQKSSDANDASKRENKQYRQLFEKASEHILLLKTENEDMMRRIEVLNEEVKRSSSNVEKLQHELEVTNLQVDVLIKALLAISSKTLKPKNPKTIKL